MALKQQHNKLFRPIIGVDFDNTLISYGKVFFETAVKLGLVSTEVGPNKKEIRDRIRTLPDGEIVWQKLQALVYGPMIAEATLIAGVKNFFSLCRRQNIQVFIVSHKTPFAKLDQSGTNLQQAALEWMQQQGFFERDGMALSAADVFFEITRQDKIARIKSLQCTHFIDDLEETFLEESFPAEIRKILYSPHRVRPTVPDIVSLTSWDEICHYFFRM